MHAAAPTFPRTRSQMFSAAFRSTLEVDWISVCLGQGILFGLAALALDLNEDWLTAVLRLVGR